MSARLPDKNFAELTSREREVLDLLRRRLTNEQIADRLGISLDGVKYHVSQILSKLGVSSREEAVRTWEADRPRGLARWLAVPLAAKLAGAAIVAGAAVGLGILADGVVGNGDDVKGTAAATPVPYVYTGKGPLIGQDHWHAVYRIYIGDERQPIFPVSSGGIHTQGDGIIHIEPKEPDEEGANATLARFFANAGGELTDTIIRLPGSDLTYRNGDPVPGDGRPGAVIITANSGLGACGETAPEVETATVPAAYVPQDGDIINVYFVPAEIGPWATYIPQVKL